MREIWDKKEAERFSAAVRRVGLRLGPQHVDPDPGWLVRSRGILLPTEPGAWVLRAGPIATVLGQIGGDAVAALLADGSGLAPPAIEFRADNPEELAVVARRFGAVDWVAWVATGATADTWALLSTEWYQLWVGAVELIEAVAGGSREKGCDEFLRYVRTFKPWVEIQTQLDAGGPAQPPSGGEDLRAWLDEVYRRYCG